ncbi:MAG: NHLP leader peptide family natural product precursor [Burkholderiales bacterium]|nr:NHLP leader peptide family natural product precursor [Burkholderiales bacterium]
MSQDSFESIMHRIVLRCWADAELKAQLLADPVAVLQAQGLQVPAGVQVRVVQDSAQVVHWVLPSRPSELSDAALEAVAGGGPLSGDLSSTSLPQIPGGWWGDLIRRIAPTVRPIVNL